MVLNNELEIADSVDNIDKWLSVIDEIPDYLGVTIFLINIIPLLMRSISGLIV